MESIKKEILRLKQAMGAVVLAHNYQIPEIQDIADMVGDSLELAMEASRLTSINVIVLCGVRFMAETAKIVSPKKRVFLVAPDAGCPMADMATPAAVTAMKARRPAAGVVSYVNSSAETKALSDACCTSSNAVEVVRGIPFREILFLPDKNLAWFAQQRVPEKKVIPWDGYCFVHRSFTTAEVESARKTMPDAEIIVHPECEPEVQKTADVVCSTSGMLRHARESSATTFVIGTEEAMLYRLRKELPEKTFLPLGAPKRCGDMKKASLPLVRDALARGSGEVFVPPHTAEAAEKALKKMLSFAKG